MVQFDLLGFFVCVIFRNTSVRVCQTIRRLSVAKFSLMTWSHRPFFSYVHATDVPCKVLGIRKHLTSIQIKAMELMLVICKACMYRVCPMISCCSTTTKTKNLDKPLHNSFPACTSEFLFNSKIGFGERKQDGSHTGFIQTRIMVFLYVLNLRFIKARSQGATGVHSQILKYAKSCPLDIYALYGDS